jgi:hypothetical protein
MANGRFRPLGTKPKDLIRGKTVDKGEVSLHEPKLPIGGNFKDIPIFSMSEDIAFGLKEDSSNTIGLGNALAFFDSELDVVIETADGERLAIGEIVYTDRKLVLKGRKNR